MNRFVHSIRIALLSLTLSGLAAPTMAQSDEEQIRAVVAKFNEGAPMPLTKERIRWFGPFPRPEIMNGQATQETLQLREKLKQERHNGFHKDVVERLVVAKSGDVAYEFGYSDNGFTDNEGKIKTWKAAYLRAWRKEDNQWKVDVTFMRGLDTKLVPIEPTK